MLSFHRTALAASLLVLSVTAWSGSAPQAGAQDEKKETPKAAGALLSKSGELTDDDEKDTNPQTKNSPRKVYKMKLAEGKAYQFDLKSKVFDAVLRLEDSTGKEVAFNDDFNPPALDSRIIYIPTKAGEYKIIVTCLDGKQTQRQNSGQFSLEVKLASEKDAADARLQARVQGFADSSKEEQKKLVAELTKDFQAKGENVTMKDAQTAATLFIVADDSDPAFLRDMGKTFIKIFDGASDKRTASLSGFLKQQMKQLDKIGTNLEITGMRTDGKEYDLKNLKGKVVLVDFWGTWCPPCVAEVPNMIKAYEKFHAKGFEIIGVAQDKSDEVVVDFLKAKKAPWPCINIEDSRKLIQMYQINSYPTPMLVGPDGRVVSLRARGPQLERLLDRLLAEKKSK